MKKKRSQRSYKIKKESIEIFRRRTISTEWWRRSSIIKSKRSG